MTAAMRVLTVALLLGVASASALAQAGGVSYARVTYVSGSSVYVDAGERDGLVEGASLDVLRGGTVVATLRARYLSPGRAQCEILPGGGAVGVGDTVRFIRAAVRAQPDRDTSPVVTAPAASRVMRSLAAALRGRVGVRYLASVERDSGGARLAQPALDLRVDGNVPGAPRLDVALDARARRTRAIAIDGTVIPVRTATLVYQAALGWAAPGGARLRVGRQYAPDVAAISLFDGALMSVERAAGGAGFLAGTQPDGATMGLSTRIREYGAYASLRLSPAAGRLATTVGAITSYDGAQVNRDFAFLSTAWSGERASFHGVQEFDYNRGWRASAEASRVTPTSTYVSAHLRATHALSLRAGYDTRRSIRLYRNYISPEIAFDDSFRTGVWGGVHADLPRQSSVSLDVRRSSGGAVDTTAGSNAARASEVVTAAAGIQDVGLVPVGVRARSSLFRSPAATGWLHSLSAYGSPAERLRLELAGGLRRDTPRPGTAAAAISDHLTVRWLQLDADVSLARAWYLLLSLTSERGGWESADQLYSALTYRF